MVIVAAIALSTMVFKPYCHADLGYGVTGGGASMSGDVRNVVLLARRLAIAGVVFLGYLYFYLSGGGAALTSIGLVSFAGVVQVFTGDVGRYLLARAQHAWGRFQGCCVDF